MPPVGKPKHQYDADQTPSDIVSRVIDDTFLNRFILYTNGHGRNDEKFKESLRKYLEREGFQKMNEVEIYSEDFSG